MKGIYEKTITSIFIMPTLGINREDLYKNKFLNAYLGDIDKEEYHEENVVFLLFKPKDLKVFKEFLDYEYENSSIIDDYDYEPGYVVLVYNLNPNLESDFSLILQGKYSKVSDEYKELFPVRVINYSKKGNPTIEAIQPLIFNKDIRLLKFWERDLNDENDVIRRNNLEIWPGFDQKKEILDIEKIKEDGKRD